MLIFDIVVLVLLLWGLYSGFKNGFFVELSSTIAFIAGLVGAFLYSNSIADFIANTWDIAKIYADVIGFIVTFILIVAVIKILAKVLTNVANMAFMGWLNSILGGVIGVLKSVVIISALLLVFDRVNNTIKVADKEKLEKSVLYEPIISLGKFVFGKIIGDDNSGNDLK